MDWEGQSAKIARSCARPLAAALMASLLAIALPARAEELSRLREHVTFLAAPELEGRAPGTPGDQMARDYIVAAMESIGLEPGSSSKTFCSGFEAVTAVDAAPRATLRVGERVLASGIEFIPAGFSDTAPFAGPAVFAGYGLHRPDLGLDDFAALDVKGRVVIALAGAPPHVLDGDDLHHVSGAMAEAKAAYLLSRGARGLILINGPEDHGHRQDQRTDALPTMRPAPALEGIAVAHLTARVGQALLGPVGIDLAQIQRDLNAGRAGAGSEGNPRPVDLEIRGAFAMQRTTSTLYNCVGLLRANRPLEAGEDPPPPLILGAHYDGLGMGIAGTFHTQGPAFHPGADDNASGVAILLEVARTMKIRDNPRAQDVYFVALAGEELGLLGARRKAQIWREARPVSAAGVYVNLDMVGRLRNGRIFVASHDPQNLPAPGRPTLAMTRAARTAQLAIHFETPGSRFSDHLAFLDAGFIALNVTTGRHGDYHLPSDTIDRVEWRGMARIVALLADVFEDLAGP